MAAPLCQCPHLGKPEPVDDAITSARLPPEIIDAIINYVDNPDDLLSMACLRRSTSKYALKLYYRRFFQSHGVPWISRLLWPGTQYDDPLKDRPSLENEHRALKMLKKGTPFCDPNDIWYRQSPDTSDISYLYFRWKGGIGTGYYFGRYPLLHFAAYSGLDSIVEHLLESGANVNAIPDQFTSDEDVDVSHLTPLFLAAYGASLTSARILLDHGAHIEESWVAALQSGNAELVQLMIDRDPDMVRRAVTVHNKHMNPFSVALDFSDGDPLPIIETLIANGADTTYENPYNRNVHEQWGFVQGLVAIVQQRSLEVAQDLGLGAERDRNHRNDPLPQEII